MLADLKKFLMRGNVIDLAVAVVIGVAFGAVVTSLVDNVVNPIIAAVFGEPDIAQVLTVTLRESPEGDAVLRIGSFLQSVLDFVIIGTALFFVVQAYNRLQSVRDTTDPEETPVPSDDIVLLTEIRDALRDRS